LIHKADETKRERVLGRREEEMLLLALSDDGPRGHIRALVIASLDTGWNCLRVRRVKAGGRGATTRL